MKKILLLALAVAGMTFAASAADKGKTAFAVVPQAATQVSKMMVANPNPMATDAAGHATFKAPRKAPVGAPGTAYNRDKSMFFCGITYPGTYSMVSSRMKGFPFEDMTFISYTTDANSLLWEYVDPADFEADEPATLTLEGDTALTVRYDGYTFTYAPTLTGSNKQGDSTFVRADYLNLGGYITSFDNGGVTEYVMASNYPQEWCDAGIYRNPTQAAVGGSANAYWTSDYKTYVSEDVDTVRIVGFAETISKPVAPYMLNAVCCHGYGDETAGGVALYIAKVEYDADGYMTLGDTICTSYSQVVPREEGSNWTEIYFSNLTYVDPETGLDEDLVITDEVIVMMRPDEGVNFVPFWTPHELVPDENHAFLLSEIELGGNVYESVEDANWHYSVGYTSAWMFGFDVSIMYLHNMGENEWNAPVEGGSQEFDLRSYYSSGAWDIYTTDYDDLPDWLTLETEDGVVEQDGEEYYNGEVKLTLTAEALPDGVDSRTCDILLSYPGAELVLHVTQGEGEVPPVGLVGDVNNDGAVDGSDANILINIILNKDSADNYGGRADANGDGVVDGGDLNKVINIILGKE